MSEIQTVITPPAENRTTVQPAVENRTALQVGQGPAGPKGDKGDQGDQGIQGIQGPPGAGGDLHYPYNQGVAASVWTITHNLGKRPSVIVIDSSGDEVEGDIDYIDQNSLQLTFSAPFSGTAYLN